VKFAVNIFSSSGEKKTLYTKGINSEKEAELTLNYYIDYDKTEVKVSLLASENYLQEYESKLKERALAKDYNDVDISAIRQNVLRDIPASINFSVIRAEKEQSKPEEKAKECLRFWQVAQKNVKSIWEEGTMHKGTWHSNDINSLYNRFPDYAHFGPIITGACDEIIDEIIGIPLMIKTGYELMSDDQKRQVLIQTFTSKQGITTLWKGLKDEFVDLASDNQKQEYIISQVTTSVGISLATGGGNSIIKGANNANEVLDDFANLANKLSECPSLAKYFKEIDKAGRTKLKELIEVIEPEKLEKALRYINKSDVSDMISKLHKLRELEGIDLVVSDLGHESYKKYLGSRFVLDYASKMDEALIAGKKIAFGAPISFNYGGKEVDRVYDIVVKDGNKTINKELKAWSSWQNWSDEVIRTQFIKDISNPDLKELDELNWIFKKTEGINDIEVLKDKVIGALESEAGKEMLQKTYSKNAYQFKKLFGIDIRKIDDIINAIDNNFELIFKID
jgi:hypothetical protein